ncbi:hypothetical protein CRUP_027779, partial [Coryphaenoides rupestris]
MANQAWIEASLRRSALLGLEVLERASRRRADWTKASLTLQTPTADHENGRNPPEGTHRPTHLNEAFESIGEFMAQTTQQCMNFHRLGDYSEFSGAERTHVSRFHRHQHQAYGRILPTWKQDCSSPREDFHIEVSPGSYTITAGMPHAHQQTQR